MSDNTSTKNSLISLPDLPDSVDKALSNLTDKPTQGIGQTLSDCWFLLFGGISQLAEKRRAKYVHNLEVFKTKLQSSIENVPLENRKEPSSQIVLKALDEAKYCVEQEELCELYISLLTSSIDSTKDVHPSFATIISQMSPVDAKMLQIFKNEHIYPICDLVQVVNERGSFQIIAQNIFVSGPKSIAQKEQSISISSLIHLGLLEIPFDKYVEPESIYEQFKNTDIYMHAQAKYATRELDLHKKIVKLTSLGELFVSCCIPNHMQNILN